MTERRQRRLGDGNIGQKRLLSVETVVQAVAGIGVVVADRQHVTQAVLTGHVIGGRRAGRIGWGGVGTGNSGNSRGVQQGSVARAHVLKGVRARVLVCGEVGGGEGVRVASQLRVRRHERHLADRSADAERGGCSYSIDILFFLAGRHTGKSISLSVTRLVDVTLLDRFRSRAGGGGVDSCLLLAREETHVSLLVTESGSVYCVE